jgi:hypothetical protein
LTLFLCLKKRTNELHTHLDRSLSKRYFRPIVNLSRIMKHGSTARFWCRVAPWMVPSSSLDRSLMQQRFLDR